MMKRMAWAAAAVVALFGTFSDALAQRKVVVELWNWLPQYERQFWDKAAVQFNARQKGVAVEMKYREVGFEELPVLFAKNLASQPDALPDILSIEFNQWPIYAAAQAAGLVDITKITNKPNAPFSAAFQEEYTLGGKKYAAAFQASPLVFAYNQQVLEKAGLTERPQTWNDFASAAELLSKKGVTLGMMDLYDFQIWYGLFLQRGGNLVDVKGEIVLHKHFEDATAVFELLKRLYKAGLRGYSTPGFVNGAYAAELKAGKLAGVVGGDWVLPLLKNQVPEQSGQWKLQPTPSWRTGFDGVATGGTGYAVAAKAGRSADDTKLLLSFLEFAVLSTQMQAVYYKDHLLQMTNLQIANNHTVIQLADPFFGGQKLAFDLKDEVKNMAIRRTLINQQALVKIYNTGVEAYYEGKISGPELFERMVKAASSKGL
jgi:ABC-type glycerol-3-phosphate transport system substrate-binding protein